MKKTVMIEDSMENNVTSEALIDIDTFMNLDGISSAWINGLMVYVASKGGLIPRSLSEWRSILATYQGLR